MRKLLTLIIICFGIWNPPYSKASTQSPDSDDHLLELIEQANRELEQDPRMIESKRLMDGEMFMGCTGNGAQDSLKFFLKKLDNLNKFNSSPSSIADYSTNKTLYYHYARKASRYAQQLQLSHKELIKIYDKIEHLFIDFPKDTIASLCFNLEKTRLSTDRQLELGDYLSHELTKYINNSSDSKKALLRLFWPATYFFGRFNSAPYLLQQIAEGSLAEEDYKNTFYYVDRAIHWYRLFLRDYSGFHNRIRCDKIKDEAYNLEKTANGGNPGYANLSTKADMSDPAREARKSSMPFFSLGDTPDVVTAYYFRELALDYIAENNFDLGTYYLQRSIDAFNGAKEYLNQSDQSFLAHNYLVLSNAYEQMGDTDNAIKALTSGISTYPEKDPEKPVFETSHFLMLLNLANIYFDNDKKLSAYKTMQTADKLWNEEGELHFDFIPLIGITYSSKDQILGAITTQYLYACARRNISKGNYRDAELILNKIIEDLDKYNINDSNLRPIYLACLIDVLISQNDIEEAQLNLNTLLSSSKSNTPINVLVHANILAAKLDMKNGDESKALLKCNAALSLLKDYISSTLMLLSESEREKFYSKIEPDFNELISILTSPKVVNVSKSANLLTDISLISKGILLSSSNYLKYLVLSSNDKKLKKLYNRIKELRENDAVISSESSADNNSSSELTRLEFELLNHPIIKTSIANWSSFILPSMSQIQGILKDDEIAIDFIKFDTELESHSIVEPDQLYYAIVIDNKHTPVFVPISRGKDLSLELKNLSPAVCDIVWEPLKNYIGNSKTVYFSPVGVLHNLPLENLSNVLNSQNTKVLRISSLRELVADKSVSSKSKAILFGGINYNSGASEFNSLATDRSAKKRAFSSDEATRAGISPLQHTLGEVTGIKKSIDNSNKTISVIVKSADKASENYLRSLDNSDLNILHFATHGFYYEDISGHDSPRNIALSSTSPRLSAEDLAMNRTGLFLAGANANFKNLYLDPSDDGILTAREVSELYFPNLKLVVLSACKTGLGDINEDGVYGLQRGFKKAGAKTVLMSLWEVNDLATSMLVQEFYKSWLATGSQSEALKLAQDKVRKYKNESNDFSNPFFWAGFVLLDAES